MSEADPNENGNSLLMNNNRQEFIIKILELINRSVERTDVIRDIIILIKEFIKFDAVGIRLREGEDYPYYETKGFSVKFVDAEKNLCTYNERGELIRDSSGAPILECMCGHVISERRNPYPNHFTEYGSFWINNTSELLELTHDWYDKDAVRNRCFSEGYESLALIPLRSNNEIIGLLQLNDRRKNMLTSEMIIFFEGIGASIGIALKRKLIEDALILSEKQFHDLYNSAPIAYFTIGFGGVIVKCNSKAGELLRYEIDELIGKPVFELYADTLDGKVKAIEVFDQFRKGKMINNEELQMQRADGTLVWISLTVNPVKDEGDKVIESRSMVVDITERKEAEEALMRSEERYTLAQQAANIGSWDWDIASGKLQWSDTIEPMFGFDRGEFGATYDAFLECVYDSDRQYVVDSVNACIEMGKEYAIEHRIVWPDGTVRWVSENGDVIRDSNGYAIRMLGIVKDITKRKQADEELINYRNNLEEMVKERTTEIESVNKKLQLEIKERLLADEERNRAYTELNQIFSTLSIGVAYIDKELNYIRVNKRFLEMFHLKEDEVVGNKCHNILNNSRCNTQNCTINSILANKQCIEFEVNKIMPDGREIICLVNSVPYISKEGEIIGIIQYYIDITENREIQREILHISEQERHRIGNDLHDVIGQNLTAIAFLVEACRQKMSDRLYSDASDKLEHIDGLIRNAIVQTRKLTKMLRPVEMEKGGFRSALEVMASSIEEIFNVSCRVIQKGEFVIDDIQIAVHLFYIAREAVNNSIKHGKPKNIFIYLVSEDLYLNMVIRDDGIGLIEPKSDTGMGLRIIQYRANMIGAEFYAKNHKQGGFIIEVRLRK